ncbi:MAG: response regulator [Caldilineaceae bacterium]|nr:response regulator [Caldilineaceae bacterium]
MYRNQFVENLRTALMQLDDLQALRQSPLLELFDQRGAAPNPVYLQQLLFEGIEKVREVNSPRAEQLYEILYYRYVEQDTQTNVAYQMGMSVRQLRREQNSAIELLSELLWDRIQSPVGVQNLPFTPYHEPQAYEALQSEISWLHEFHAEASDLRQELALALEKASPIAEHYGVKKLHTALPDQMSAVAVPPMALRQVLLTAITAMISTASPNTTVGIAVEQPAQTSLCIKLRQENHSVIKGVGQQQRSMVETIAHLLAPFDGYIDLEDADTCAITITLPGIESIPVLVVDDNPDVKLLLQRYVANTRFRVIATDKGELAIPLVAEHSIRAIIVDIMMPGDDGWTLLAQLRHHPETKDLPIAVCTILPQRELSLLLGATGFIQKPVQQTAFLNLLSQLVAT